MTRQTSSSQRLYESAQGQGGFFTTRQAHEAGFKDNVHPYHVRAGNWVRERRGVYRLAQFPLPARPDLMIWQLWSRNRQDQPQGVFSHATALTLHELSDAMPAKLDMTVPPGFQRMAATPEQGGTGTMAALDWSDCPAVESIPGKVSGAWVFENTRSLDAQG